MGGAVPSAPELAGGNNRVTTDKAKSIDGECSRGVLTAGHSKQVLMHFAAGNTG